MENRDNFDRTDASSMVTMNPPPACWIVRLLAVACLAGTTGCPGPIRGDAYCYTFSVVHESCTVFGAKNIACEAGTNREYAWSAGCLGYFDAYHGGPIEKCFGESLESKGPCSEGVTGSLPPGGQVP